MRARGGLRRRHVERLPSSPLHLSCLSKIDRPAAFELRLSLGRAFLRFAPEGKPIKWEPKLFWTAMFTPLPFTPLPV